MRYNGKGGFFSTARNWFFGKKEPNSNQTKREKTSNQPTRSNRNNTPAKSKPVIPNILANKSWKKRAYDSTTGLYNSITSFGKALLPTKNKTFTQR